MKKYGLVFFSLMVSLSVLAQDKLNTGLNIYPFLLTVVLLKTINPSFT